MKKSELRGMQGKARSIAVIFSNNAVPAAVVDPLPANRVTKLGEVNSNLVGSPGLQATA